MNKRYFAALAAGMTLLVAGLLAGCGNNDAAPADGAAAPTTAPAGDKMASPAGDKMASPAGDKMASPAGDKMASPAAAPPGPK